MNKSEEVFSPEYVAECFRYNPETGEIWRRIRPIEHFSSRRYYLASAATVKPEPIIALDGSGYVSLNLAGKTVRGHRVAWCLFYGEWPSGDIDHINHDRSDNRLKNLRVVSKAENLRNQKKRNTNTSGYNGVWFHKRLKRWVAQATVDGKTKYLGQDTDKLVAIEIRRDWERENGYHENNGC